MGVFKEEAHTFETIAKNQTRIYNDAADYGYPYNTKNPPSEVTAVFKAIKEMTALDKEFQDERPLVRNREEWGDGVSVDVIIFWEEDEGYYRGTKYHITHQKTGRHFSRLDKTSDAFLSVDVEPYMEKV